MSNIKLHNTLRLTSAETTVVRQWATEVRKIAEDHQIGMDTLATAIGYSTVQGFTGLTDPKKQYGTSRAVFMILGLLRYFGPNAVSLLYQLCAADMSRLQATALQELIDRWPDINHARPKKIAEIFVALGELYNHQQVATEMLQQLMHSSAPAATPKPEAKA